MANLTKDLPTTRTLLSLDERNRVAQQLDNILASPLFGQSKRYAPFLRHVVQETLMGHEVGLKERILGIEIFGRSPDYDSNNDPVVRVTAGEVRKRIAQYYNDPAHRHEYRIYLPIGTYVAHFHPAPEEQPIEPEPEVAALPPQTFDPSTPVVPVKGSRNRFLPTLIFFTLAVCLGIAWKLVRRTSTLDRVWNILAASPAPTLVAVGIPSPLSPPNGVEEPTARQHLRSDRISLSDLQALLRIVSLMGRKDMTYRVQPAGTTTFSELRQGPTILLGGLDNPWTLRAQKNLRFGLDTDGNGVDWISDSHDRGTRKWSVDFNRPYTQVTTDYAIIALTHDPDTQQPTLIIAGMGENGTKAASEFITDNEQLTNALGDVWRKTRQLNFEVVITTAVINGFSGAPKILAQETW